MISYCRIFYNSIAQKCFDFISLPTYSVDFLKHRGKEKKGLKGTFAAVIRYNYISHSNFQIILLISLAAHDKKIISGK